MVVDIRKMTLSELPKFEMVKLLTSIQWPETRNIITLTLFILWGNLTQNSRFTIDKSFKIPQNDI